MVAFRDPGAPETVTQRTMDPGPIDVRAEVSAGYSVKLKTLYLRFGLSAVLSHRVVVFRTCVV